MSTHPTITICPPMPAHGVGAFDDHQFGCRRAMPVNADFGAGGSITSTGISYEDFTRMSTSSRRQSGQRRTPTPEWALDPPKVRAVVTRYFELRAGLRKHQPGTEKERLARAQALLLEQKKNFLVPNLDRLSAEYVAAKQSGVADAKTLRRMASDIRNIDTLIRTIDGGPAALFGVVYFYYSLRLDSVGTASQLGFKSPWVRQTLFRLVKTAERMKAGTDGTAELKPRSCRICRAEFRPASNFQSRRICEGCRAAKAEQELAARVGKQKVKDDAKRARREAKVAVQSTSPVYVPRTEPRACRQCGMEFTPQHGRERVCSDECKLIRKHAERKSYRQRKQLERGVHDAPTGKSLSVTVAIARESGHGDANYEKYLEFCERMGIAPTPFAVWELVR